MFLLRVDFVGMHVTGNLPLSIHMLILGLFNIRFIEFKAYCDDYHIFRCIIFRKNETFLVILGAVSSTSFLVALVWIFDTGF